MLKTLRLALAVLCLCGFLLLFLFPGAAASVPALAWLARIQLAPAVLAGSLVIAGAHLLCALLFGRVYCSIVCPLGLLQDLAGRIVSLGLFRGHYRGPAHGRFRWAAIPAWPRTLVLLVSAAAFAAGMPLLLSLLEPYSLFGRMASTAAAAGQTLAAAAGAEPGAVRTAGVIPALSALVTLAVLIILVRRWGRVWCSTVCPVGAFLSWPARLALFRIRIDGSRCAGCRAGCRACEHACKASCLSVRERRADPGRCLGCFNCLSACRYGAISFSPRSKD